MTRHKRSTPAFERVRGQIYRAERRAHPRYSPARLDYIAAAKAGQIAVARRRKRPNPYRRPIRRAAGTGWLWVALAVGGGILLSRNPSSLTNIESNVGGLGSDLQSWWQKLTGGLHLAGLSQQPGHCVQNADCAMGHHWDQTACGCVPDATSDPRICPFFCMVMVRGGQQHSFCGCAAVDAQAQGWTPVSVAGAQYAA